MTLRNAQKPKLETRLALIEQRVNDLVERHETVPGRVTRLEGEFEHMGAQLAALHDGQRELTATVSDIGTKVTRMLAALTVLGVIAQALGPTLFRMLIP
ncbi:hypothetical protein ACIQUF_11695 [Pseudomonas sp. NPDC090233]|uniref:hypothetical protein n=1 Tax=Pseudomonas sp. NPDC090233 TaxID=3364479 RepID=UPI00383B5596